MTKKWFCYVVKQVFTGAQTLTPQLVFANDSQFQLQEIRSNSDTYGDFGVLISTSSGDNFSNVPFDASEIGIEGNDSIKFWSKDIVIEKNTQWNVEITAGGAGTLELQFWGYKIPC